MLTPKQVFAKFIRDIKDCFLEKCTRNWPNGLNNIEEFKSRVFLSVKNVTFREFTGLKEKPLRGVQTQVTGIVEEGQSEVKFWSILKVTVGRLKVDGRDQARNFQNT